MDKPKIKLGINIQLWDRDGTDRTIRYFQVGYELDGKFTGYIVDYTGGGTFSDFYFINDVYHSGGAFEFRISEFIQDEINKLQEWFIRADYDEWIFYARENLMEAFKNVPEHKVFSYGADIVPITVGNTRFPKKPSRDRVYDTYQELYYTVCASGQEEAILKAKKQHHEMSGLSLDKIENIDWEFDGMIYTVIFTIDDR
jgi:hypothetical protein